MKILLVRPYSELKVARELQRGFLHLEPLDLEIVAGGIKNGDVQILDLSLEKNPLKIFFDKLGSYHPDIVGFCGYSSQNGIVKQLAALTKTFNKNILVVVGGVHATIVPKDYKIDSIDVVVRGEGSIVIQPIIDKFAEGETIDIPGKVLSTRDAEFERKADLPLAAYPDPRDVSLPRRDLVNREKYFCVWTSSDTGKLDSLFPATASLRTSMGCAFNCSFCVVHHLMGGKYIQRDPQDVTNEIEALGEDYVYFVDDEMFLNVERARQIAEALIKRGVKKRYISWTRADTIVKNPELFQLWKQAGLDTLYVGVESVDEARLKEYSKRATVDTNKKAAKTLKEIGIMLHAAFIVHPDFSVEDFRQLEREIKLLTPAELTFTVLSPSPGTKFWHDNKHRFICDPYKYYDCMHSVLPVKMPMRKFYQHFGRLTQLALRANPLRVNKVRVPFKDFIRAIVSGTRYIFSLYLIYKDYPKEMWLKNEYR